MTYKYQIKCFAAPYSDGEIIAEFDSLTDADKYWRRNIAVGRSAAVLDHGLFVTDGSSTWPIGDAPDDALRT